MSYTLWIPLTILTYVLFAYVTRMNNTVGGIWFWILWLPLPLWAFVSKHSKNLLLDGMLFDVVMITSYTLALCFLGEGASFNIKQWLGVAIALSGMLLIKLGG